jgi:hypothetical protein
MVPLSPGNAGGGTGPYRRHALEWGEGLSTTAVSAIKTLYVQDPQEGALPVCEADADTLPVGDEALPEVQEFDPVVPSFAPGAKWPRPLWAVSLRGTACASGEVCGSAGCGKSARPVGRGGARPVHMVSLVRHCQTKEAAN